MQFSFGNRPSELPLQLILLLISLVNSFRLIFQFLMKPFGTQTFFTQFLGGIAVGPSFLGRSKIFYDQYLYAPKCITIVSFFRAIAFMFLLFLLSMRLDLTIIKKCGKLALVIGIATLIVPLVVTVTFAYFLREYLKFEVDLYGSLPSVAILVSNTSFHVILVVLTDLKLLNSELGRLALSSSMISGISSWAFLAIVIDIKEELQTGIKAGVIYSQVSKILVVLLIVFAFRPIMFWMVRRTPDGKPLKEPFICGICLMVLTSSFLSEISGPHFHFAPIILGMATPAGPPMVSSLMEKIDCFVEVVLVPFYVLDAGRRTNIFLIKPKNFGVIELMMLVGSLAKLVAVIIPSLYFKMPLLDAVSLGFILNCKGLFDVQLYSRANKVRLITDENFASLNIASMIHAVVFSWLVKLVYDPSRRYVAYRKRTIQHSFERSSELKILACIHQQDNVPSIISMLEDSNPTKDDPIGVYVMNLKQSVGGTVPLLISHQLGSSSSYQYHEIDHIINAFYQIEHRNEGLAMVQCFTSYAPYPTLHDAVCSMAQEKSTSLIVLPFRHSDDPSIRIVNKNILQYAPCSVAIMFDNGKLARSILPSQTLKRVCLVFLGGPDDRETLAFGARMAMHPYIVLIVIRFISEDQSDADLIEKRRDLNSINEFRIRTRNCMNDVKLVEYTVKEGCETAKVLREICNGFELILAGRRHDPSSALVIGLSEWKVIDELGVIGDMLASSDFDCRAPVLVLQQQASVVQQMIESPRNTMSRRISIIDRLGSSIASSRS